MGADSPKVFQSTLLIILSFTLGQDRSRIVATGLRDDFRVEHKLGAVFNEF
jgi:hypothetical protein